MKKILAFVLAVACTLSLAGCGGNNARPEDVSDAPVEEQLPEPGGAASFNDEGSEAEGQPTETPQGGVVSLDEIQEKFNSLVYEDFSKNSIQNTDYHYRLYSEMNEALHHPDKNIYDFGDVTGNELIAAWGEPARQRVDDFGRTYLYWHLDEPLDVYSEDFPDLCAVPDTIYSDEISAPYLRVDCLSGLEEHLSEAAIYICGYHEHSPEENYGALWDGTVVCSGMLRQSDVHKSYVGRDNSWAYYTGTDNVVEKLEVTGMHSFGSGYGYEATVLWGEGYTVSDVTNANPNLGDDIFALYGKKSNVPDEIDPSKPLTAYVSGPSSVLGDYDNPVYVNGVCVQSIDDVPALIDVIGAPSEVFGWNMVSSEYFDASDGYATGYTWYMGDGWAVSIYEAEYEGENVIVQFSGLSVSE